MIPSQHVSQWRKSLLTGCPNLPSPSLLRKWDSPLNLSSLSRSLNRPAAGAAAQSGSEDYSRKKKKTKKTKEKRKSSSIMDVKLLVLLCLLAVTTHVPSSTGESPHFFPFFYYLETRCCSKDVGRKVYMQPIACLATSID